MLKRLSPYIKYLWRVTEGFHRTVILRTLLGVVRVGIVLLFIWFSKTAIDCATGRVPASTSTLVGWFALMVACMLADVLISQGVKYMESRAIMQMNNKVNRRLFNILMDFPLVNGQQGFHSGDMLNRLTLDVRSVSSFALSQLPSMVVMAVQLLGAFIFLAWLNPWLALAPLVIMPVCLAASKMYFRRQRRLSAEIRDGESDMHVSIQEGLQHRMVIKSLECTGEMDRRLSVIQQKLNSSNREQTRLSSVSGAAVRFGFIIGYLTAFGWSIFSLKAGIITFGTMTAFIQLVSRIQHPIAGIAGYIPSFITTSVAVDRLREIDESGYGASRPHEWEVESGSPSPHEKEVGYGASRPHEREVGSSAFRPHKEDVGSSAFRPHKENPRLLPSPAGVRVSDLSFRYESEGNDVLSSFSHDFRPGSRTMIVGSTGAGKTTLIKLLLGLLKPDSGTISIYSGYGASRPHKEEVRSSTSRPHEREVEVSAATLANFVYVPQGNSLLQGTIRENLLLAAPNATDEQLAEALHTAAADFVYDLPQGLDTPCDEVGGGLSEGQAQRIAIARALLRPGSILLLDEFNSALDTETAATLMQRLSQSRPNSTIIIIAHHQTVIAPYCDTILHIS